MQLSIDNHRTALGDLSRMECTALRGLAILAIMLHNYCHWLGGIVQENEYQYIQGNVNGLDRVLANPDLLLPVHLISFFGHYGVPVFLFLSAYGLELKYGGNAAQPVQTIGQNARSAWHFISYHFAKLWRMMIAGFIIFVVIDNITPGAFHYNVVRILTMLGMVNNFLPNPDTQIWPGPYWYFGLMLQLYVVYRLLLYRRHWGWTVALMAVCIGIQFCFDPEGEAMNWYRYNFMGGVLPFGTGLLYARFCRQTGMNKAIWWMELIVSAFCIMELSHGKVGWTFTPMFICSFTIALIKILPTTWLKPLTWLGALSAALFVIHPTVRKIIIPISRHGDVYTGLLLYIIVALGAAWLLRLVMTKIPKPTMKS